MTLKKRLADLEAVIKPKKKLPIISVFEAEGRRWITDGKHDYRQAIAGQYPGNEPPGVKYITQAEFDELEKTHEVWLVQYVKYKDAYSFIEDEQEVENDN